jgi:hypothetical protein
VEKFKPFLAAMQHDPDAGRARTAVKGRGGMAAALHGG